jgi:hypothetical protein
LAEIERKTYNTIAARIENIDTALGGQRLRAGDDAFGTVDDAAPARELHEGI